MGLVTLNEFVNAFRGPVQNNVDIVVAGEPGIEDEFGGKPLEGSGDVVPELIECLP